MKKYFCVQFKRAAKFFPYILTVTMLLLVGLSVIFGNMFATTQKNQNQKFNIAVTGDLDNQFLKLAISAFKTFDETRFSLDFIEMTEAQAATALKDGDVSAYIVLPEDFVEKALRGVVDPIKFVTTVESSDITTIFKNELTKVVTDMVIAAQKGSYGIGDALTQNGYNNIANEHINQISIQYLDLIMSRNKPLQVEELGVSSGLTTTQYYICSIIILLIMIMGLPFACLYCKKDNALSALLISKGVSGTAQLLSEFIAHLIFLLTLTAVVFGGTSLATCYISTEVLGELSPETIGALFVCTLPTVVMFAAYNVMIFELSSNIIGGLLFHFCCTLSLCYVSGCFYPIYSFPKVIQVISRFLPVGVAREQLATRFTGESAILKTVFVLAFAALFFTVAAAAKRIKAVKHAGGLTNAKSV